MTLQDLGALGELVGGIAVVISILYLALQIRHGMQGYKSNITQEVTSHFSRLQFDIAKDADLLEVWLKAERGAELSPMDQRRVLQVVSSFMIGFENLYFQYSAGMVDEDSFNARRPVMASILTSTGAREWWTEFGHKQHPPKFVAEVERVLTDHPTSSPEPQRDGASSA